MSSCHQVLSESILSGEEVPPTGQDDVKSPPERCLIWALFNSLSQNYRNNFHVHIHKFWPIQANYPLLMQRIQFSPKSVWLGGSWGQNLPLSPSQSCRTCRGPRKCSWALLESPHWVWRTSSGLQLKKGGDILKSPVSIYAHPGQRNIYLIWYEIATQKMNISWAITYLPGAGKKALWGAVL